MRTLQARDQISCPCSLGMFTAHASLGLNPFIFVQVDTKIFLNQRSAHLHTQRTKKSRAAGISYVVTLASQKPSLDISHGLSTVTDSSNSASSNG